VTTLFETRVVLPALDWMPVAATVTKTSSTFVMLSVPV